MIAVRYDFHGWADWRAHRSGEVYRGYGCCLCDDGHDDPPRRAPRVRLSKAEARRLGWSARRRMIPASTLLCPPVTRPQEAPRA